MSWKDSEDAAREFLRRSDIRKRDQDIEQAACDKAAAEETAAIRALREKLDALTQDFYRAIRPTSVWPAVRTSLKDTRFYGRTVERDRTTSGFSESRSSGRHHFHFPLCWQGQRWTRRGAFNVAIGRRLFKIGVGWELVEKKDGERGMYQDTLLSSNSTSMPERNVGLLREATKDLQGRLAAYLIFYGITLPS